MKALRLVVALAVVAVAICASACQKPPASNAPAGNVMEDTNSAPAALPEGERL